MAAYKLTDFSDIYTAVLEELKVQSTDTTTLNRIKRMINMMYLDEVIPAARWWWLYGHTTVTHNEYYGAGTVSVTPLSTTVTLSTAPSSSYGDSGSFLNYFFSIDGKNEIYRITAHTALSTTVTIDRPFNTELNTAANYKIWSDSVALPTDLRETVDVWHDHNRDKMMSRGLQEFRQVVAQDPKAESRPQHYATADFFDPSTGDSEAESDRYRQLKVYPSISQYKTLIKVDYMKEAAALDVAGDEPLMPIEDRIVLFYGALSLAWGSIGRNPEEAMRNRQLFDAKLARMMGKIQDSMDKPRLEPESRYILAKRAGRISPFGRGALSGGGQSSYTSPSYLENPTINGATVSGNITVNSGITIDGRDISADGAAFDAHIIDTTTHGTTGDIVGTSDSQILTNKTIDSAYNTVSNIVNANVSASAAIAKTKIAAGTVSRVEVTDSSGLLVESAITSTELTFLDDAEPLASATLADNTAVATLVTGCSWAVASFNVATIEYSITRGAAIIEKGIINLASDGTSTAIAQGAVASIGTTGVTFTADVNSSNMRLLYTTTSTGTAATMKFTVRKHLAQE